MLFGEVGGVDRGVVIVEEEGAVLGVNLGHTIVPVAVIA